MASFYEACRSTKDVWPRVKAYYSKTWKDYQMEPHCHIACELMYVFSGKCLVTYQDGEAEMRSGDYIFLDSNIPHALITTAAGCTMLNVEFTLEEPNDFYTVQRLMNSSVYFREMIRKKKPVFVGNDADGELFRSLDTLVVGLSAKKERDQCLARGEMAAFLLCLSQSVWENETQINANRYVRNAMLYIQHHFREKVTISQLAERQSITPDHLNRVFKESTGQTLHTFLTRIRCEHAATLLLRENSTTEDIALQCGFSSQQQFVRDFRKLFNQTPARYRRQSKRIEIRKLEDRE